MKIVNKKWTIPKTSQPTVEYVLGHIDDEKIIRWAIVETTDTSYIIEGAIEITD